MDAHFEAAPGSGIGRRLYELELAESATEDAGDRPKAVGEIVDALGYHWLILPQPRLHNQVYEPPIFNAHGFVHWSCSGSRSSTH